MTVTTERPPMTNAPSGHLPVRFSLKPPSLRSGLLDGAWCPRSRDLKRELPALTEALDRLQGKITRIAVNLRYWPVILRKAPVNGRVVMAGWFTAEEALHDGSAADRAPDPEETWESIALHHYSRFLPGGRGVRSSTAGLYPGRSQPPAVPTRRDHRDGGRGRLRPRRRIRQVHGR